MKRILLTLAIIAFITACTKTESPSPEPEPVPESYIGYKRSEHPNIKIPGVSINDEIIYDLKSAFSFCGLDMIFTELYSGAYTREDVVDICDPSKPHITPEATIGTYPQIDVYIYENIFDENEIVCRIDLDGNILQKTDNVESFRFKEASFHTDYGYYDTITDVCGFDVELTLKNGDVIEIVYYGESTHCPVMGGIK